jgi:hypothetical protein
LLTAVLAGRKERCGRAEVDEHNMGSWREHDIVRLNVAKMCISLA